MARSTLARLIQEVRDLTYAGTAEYTLGTVSYFSDDHVQTLLDRHRGDVWEEPLRPQILLTAGTSHWTTYLACRGQWESAQDGTSTVWTVRDAAGSIQGTAGYSADYVRGIVTFTNDQQGSARYLTGRVYDLYGASAELLRTWAARWSRQFDFSIGNSESYKRSQAAETMERQAAHYELKAWPVTVGLVRSDTEDAEPAQPGYTGGAAHAARG